MSDDLICAICEGDARVVRKPKEVPIGQREVVVECEFALCEECGEEFFLAGQLDEAQKAAAAQIREEEGLLQGEEIFRIRKKYGLTQETLEDLIGAGRKTVTRWENNVVFQNATTDTLLRALRKFPGLVRWLAQERNVAVELPELLFVQYASIRAFEAQPFRASVPCVSPTGRGGAGWVLEGELGQTSLFADIPEHPISSRLPNVNELGQQILKIDPEVSG